MGEAVYETQPGLEAHAHAGVRSQRQIDEWSNRVRRALRQAQDALLDLQRADGHWCAELEGDVLLEAEYILILHFLGRLGEERVRKAAAYLREKQLAEGGWPIYPGGPPEVSISTKAYFALKLVGDDPDAPPMRRARTAIRALGGLDACNSFTKIYLAIFGQYDWRSCPSVPPELVLLPKWFPVNLYAMSAWTRAICVPLTIISAHKPYCPVPDRSAIGELRVEAPPRTRVRGRGRYWAACFRAIDRSHRVLEALKFIPLRRLAIRRAERWVLERLEKSDGLGAIFPPIINTIIAFRCLGYNDDDPRVRQQVSELERLEIETETTLRVQPCRSPVWDTALSLNALVESGMEPQHPALLGAASWLLGREVREPGDWRVRAPEAPVGGWCFEYANEFYPDCDDTAQVLTSLSKVRFSDAREEQRRQEAIRRGLGWLLGMQNRDGGWASFDKDCDREFLTHVPFADHNAMIDPSTADITARALDTLGCLGFEPSFPAVSRAVDFLLRQQEQDGSWFGRWGCNYLYGTWLALWGLRQIGEDTSAPWARRAADWIRGSQNPDGGWGELPLSYDDPGQRGKGPSTAAQTAWALLGLFATGEFETGSVRRGLEYLLQNQRADGTWQDEHWTGTGFPKVFYLRYHLYATYFPLLALATYEKTLLNGRAGRERAA